MKVSYDALGAVLKLSQEAWSWLRAGVTVTCAVAVVVAEAALVTVRV
jgi:hypothetical protein